jgi:hypothetical protein
MDMKKNRVREVSVPLWMIGAVLLNLLVVNGVLIYQWVGGGAVLGESTATACPAACITKINQLAGKTVTTSAKEYYVPLGAGTNATDEWSDVPGASVSIDTASYGKIKQAIFEATVTVPSGSQRVWVRLYNVTDRHPVWFSDVTTDSSGPVLLASSPIALDKGNKVYQVQMKTQLKNLTNLVQSRVKIATY